MESQTVRPHGHSHSHEQESHIVGHHMEGEDERHIEKKSVMNKMKAQAKKIKDTITKHGHGHNHDPIPDDHDLDEEDDDEEKMVEDPEIHRAPAIKSTGQVENSGQSSVNSGRSTVADVDPLPQNVRPGAAGTVHERVEGSEQPKENLGRTTVLGEVPKASQYTPVSHATTETRHSRKDDPTRTFVEGQEEHAGQPKVNLQKPKGLEEDPATPKGTTASAYTSSNYQSKVMDSTGGEGVAPVRRSFDKMNIDDESKPQAKSGQEQNTPTGTQDFFTSVPTGSHDQFSPELTPPKPVTTEESSDGTKSQDQPYDNIADRQPNQGSYVGKISSASATSAIADKAISAKNLVASKLGYGKKDDSEGHEMHKGDKSFDSSKSQDHPHDNLADRQPNQSSYIEKISSATSQIADKAVCAKNDAAPKLEYGEKDDTGEHEMHKVDKSSTPALAADDGKKIAATVTEKPTTVYEKVAGVGSTLISKLPGTSTGTGNEKEHGVGGRDKGVSVKDYFAEKLRPGDEDKALSEVISESLRKKKPEQENKLSSSTRPASEVISEALHERNEEPHESNRPMGKVTESEEVRRTLGTTDVDSSKERMDSSFVNNSGKGVVDKIKGAVGSWFTKADETQGSQQSVPSSIGPASEEARNNSSTTEERRLHESGN